MVMQRKKRTNAGRRNHSAPVQATDPEQVRDLAYEIYETRNASGVLGDPISDWFEAERLLRESTTGRLHSNASKA
jgi:Protein of unknown function (DUF2934)